MRYGNAGRVGPSSRDPHPDKGSGGRRSGLGAAALGQVAERVDPVPSWTGGAFAGTSDLALDGGQLLTEPSVLRAEHLDPVTVSVQLPAGAHPANGLTHA